MQGLDLIGKALGKYQILEEIGRGGMGAVYKGYDASLERSVAIKVLAPHLTWESHFVERFRREAETVAALNHPNIVAIFGIGEEQGFHYLVMEYVEGEPLNMLVTRERPLPPPRALRILAQIADALDYAHSRGLIHRDVKPGNILVGSGDRVVLTDFGIARVAEGTRLTVTGMHLGTPHYMSPEQAEGKRLDARTDVYSLGVVLYEMLTGRVPFQANTPVAVLHLQTSTPPPPPRSIVPSLSSAVEQVVLRALAKEPEARYPSAGTLAQALRMALEAKPPFASPALLTGPRIRKPAWMWIAAGFMATVLVVGVVLVTGGRSDQIAEMTTAPAVTQHTPSATPGSAPTRSTPTRALTPTRTLRTATPTSTQRPATPTQTRRTPTPTRTARTPTPTRTRTPTPTATPTPRRVAITLDNAKQAKLLDTLSGHKIDVLSVAFSPVGDTLASASDDKTIRLWQAKDGGSLRVLSKHTDTVYSVAFSPDGMMLASGSRDKTVRLWRVSDGSLVQTMRGHEEKVWCVAYSPDGRLVASGSGDKTVRLWQVSNGTLVLTLRGHSKPIYGLAFSPDGKTLASASADNTIRLWRVSGGQHIRTLSGHSDNVRSVAFSPDGKTLASASFDHTVRLWQVSNGQHLRTLKGHSDEVLCVAFSPDGKMVASASKDKTVRLWRVSDGSLLQTLNGHQSRVTSVAFSSDGKLVASASDDRTLRLWGVMSY